MDGSDTRRGRPAVHRRFGRLHRRAGWRGDRGRFGTGAAILLGDLCLAWSDEMLCGSGLRAGAGSAGPAGVRRDAHRADGRAVPGPAGAGRRRRLGASGALRVPGTRAPSTRVERPLQLGAALAGAQRRRCWRRYSAYGLPLGEAFQLRDDVLGVFGDPVETGKPAGDDLREGKRTVLVALRPARSSSRPSGRPLRRHLGDPRTGRRRGGDGAGDHRATGALAEVERMIRTCTEQALAALAASPVDPCAEVALQELATAATIRRF